MKIRTFTYTAIVASLLAIGSANAERIAHDPIPAVSTAEVIRMWQNRILNENLPVSDPKNSQELQELDAPERLCEAQASGHTLRHKPVQPGKLRAYLRRVQRPPAGLTHTKVLRLSQGTKTSS